MSNINGPLAGLRVLEMSAIGPVPFAGMVLADMGADVVASTARARPRPPRLRARGRTCLGRGKRSVDRRPQAPGRRRRRARAREDRRTCCSRACAPASWSASASVPTSASPSTSALVYGRMTGFGQEGPLANEAGHDINYISVAGVLARDRPARRGRRPPLNLVGDFGGGGDVPRHRRARRARRAGGVRHGPGRRCGDDRRRRAAHRRDVQRRAATGAWVEGSSLDGGGPFYDAYETADGRYLSGGADRAPLLGQLRRRPRPRPGHRDAGPGRLGRRPRRRSRTTIRTKTRDEWMALFMGADACVAPVLDPSELFDHPHHKAREGVRRGRRRAPAGAAPRFRAPSPACRAVHRATVRRRTRCWRPPASRRIASPSCGRRAPSAADHGGVVTGRRGMSRWVRRTRRSTSSGGGARSSASRWAARHGSPRCTPTASSTARERIEAFVDAGSFEEVGTFATRRRAERPRRDAGRRQDRRPRHARRRGRSSVAADDITVKRASSSVDGQPEALAPAVRAGRAAAGNPFVYFGETGGARIPDILGSEGFAKVGAVAAVARHAPPRGSRMVTADRRRLVRRLVVHLGARQRPRRCSSTARAWPMTSPGVIEIATGEQVTNEELGGIAVHDRRTGQIDRVDTADEAYAFALAAAFLSLPAAERVDAAAPVAAGSPPSSTPTPSSPTSCRRRAGATYDMRRGPAPADRRRRRASSCEPAIGRGAHHRARPASTGRPVGIVASQPVFQAGVLDAEGVRQGHPAAVPVRRVQPPGGVPPRHAGLPRRHRGRARPASCRRPMLFQQALALARRPEAHRRAAQGVRPGVLQPRRQPGGRRPRAAPGPAPRSASWTPQVGANVLYSDALQALPRRSGPPSCSAAPPGWPRRPTRTRRRGSCSLDEIIDPADTRVALVRALRRHAGRPFSPGWERPLAAWPTIW